MLAVSGCGQGWRLAAQIALANSEDGVREPERDHRDPRPAEVVRSRSCSSARGRGSSAPASAYAARQSPSGRRPSAARRSDLREEGKEPAEKQNAMATHSATSVIGGNAVLFRSGHGRCSRPEVAVILAASHRLSVSVIMATIVAAAGAMMESAVTQRSMSPEEAVSRDPRIRMRPPRSELVMASASVPSVSMAATCQRGEACDPEQDAADRIPFELRRGRRRTIACGRIGHRPSQ